MSYDEKVAKAEARAERAARYRDQLKIVQVAEQEIPSLWDTGQVSQQQVARQYGISPATVKRILRDAGRQVTRQRKLSEEQRREVVALLRANENVAQVAHSYQVSINTIRRVGIETGVLEKGRRKPRRSDAEYEQIRAFDDELRQRFGQGLYNLGIGLKSYDQRQREKIKALANTRPVLPLGEPMILDPDEAYPAVVDAGYVAPTTPDEAADPREEPAETSPDAGEQDAEEVAPQPTRSELNPLGPEDFPSF